MFKPLITSAATQSGHVETEAQVVFKENERKADSFRVIYRIQHVSGPKHQTLVLVHEPQETVPEQTILILYKHRAVQWNQRQTGRIPPIHHMFSVFILEASSFLPFPVSMLS